MKSIGLYASFAPISWVFICAGIVSFLILLIDIIRYPQKMKVMNLVWPLNALWGNVFILWAYFAFGRNMPVHGKDKKLSVPDNMNAAGKMSVGDMNVDSVNNGKNSMDGMDMGSMDMGEKKPFWQKVVMGTLHCGSGCTLADIAGSFLFLVFPFMLFGSLTAGEWALDYILALIVGVTFQYAALVPLNGMEPSIKKGFPLWLRALKIDFFSLTAWQIGMYGWMSVIIFGLYGHISPLHIEFWFMMQVAMCAGFIIAYPVNWLLVRKGIKKVM